MNGNQDRGQTRRSRRLRSGTVARWMTAVALSALSGSALTIGLTRVSAQSHHVAASKPIATRLVEQPMMIQISSDVTQAVRKVEPNVVGVENYQLVSNFFSQQSKLQATGIGTGVMFYKDDKLAYLVTNNHVVEGAAKVDIVRDSGKHYNAEVVGTDPYTDLAVLKVPANVFKGVDPINFADSDKIEAGEPAIAIGTPLGLDFADTVTSGIVSAKSRIMPVQDEATQQTLDYQTVIQTDAAINPGNSGGPLVDIHGDVMGINSSKIVAQNFEGMGFAIPSNEVKVVAKQLMQTGHAIHPALGIEAYSLTSLPQQMWPDVPVDYGVWVKKVTSPETRAAGLRSNDVIVGLNAATIRTMADLRTQVFQTKPGDTVTLKVYRDSRLLTMRVKIGSMDTQLTTGDVGSP
ncbi:serine protease Do [Alicyclobacillus sacchari]|uniref:Serine protease Do n=1 Tax=Alicyclobacillus sacchari TaxID=392010 RepID=A0A4R8LJ00_9BACL|nr:trypsin-like peptidase domain-containing protein [Alicyclobacillus sacchari]TDY42410.1 serine protease Do [Alicyclobacillus sacchari]